MLVPATHQFNWLNVESPLLLVLSWEGGVQESGGGEWL